MDGARWSLFGGHLSLGNATVPSPSTGNPLASADMAARASAAVSTPGASDLFDDSPGVTLDIGGSYGASTPLSSLRALSAARRAFDTSSLGNTLDSSARLTAALAAKTDLAAFALGKVSLSVTPKNDGRESLSVALRADAAVALDSRGIAGAAAQWAPLVSQAAAFEKSARDAFSQIQALEATLRGPDVAALELLLVEGVNASNLNKVVALAQPLLDRLSSLRDTFNRTRSVLEDGRGLLGQLREQSLSMGAELSARGAVELAVIGRKRVLSVARGRNHVNLSLAAAAMLTVPSPAPAALPALPGAEKFHTLMVAVDAVVRVQTQGLVEMSQLLARVDDLLGRASSQIGKVADSPWSLEKPGAAAQAASDAKQLVRDGQALQGQADALLKSFSVALEPGLRTTEAHDLGVGLSQLGAEVDGRVGDVFAYRVAVIFHNLIGALPATEIDYRFAGRPLPNGAPGSLALERVGTRQTNAFAKFYPATVAFDASLRGKTSANTATELRTGTETALDGARTAVYVGLIEHLAQFFVGAGVVLPDVTRAANPLLTLSAGYEGKRFFSRLSAGFNPGALTQGGGDGVQDLSAHLALGVRY